MALNKLAGLSARCYHAGRIRPPSAVNPNSTLNHEYNSCRNQESQSRTPMKLPVYRNRGWLAPLILLVTFLLNMTYLAENPSAQERSKLPAQVSYLNDFAGAIDEKTKQRLELVLDNVKQRTGIELVIATVETTGSQDIFDYSSSLAAHWNLGARNSTKKSLLIVISMNEKAVFTRFSRSVQAQVPEGALWDMSQRVRGALNLNQFNEGLNDGVNYFISALGKRMGFSVQDVEQPQSIASTEITTLPEPTKRAKPSEDPEPLQPPPVEVETNNPLPPATLPSASPSTTGPDVSRSTNGTRVSTLEEPVDEEEEVELTLTLPLEERVSKLKEFLETFPNSNAKPRAIELLISSYASLGDQKLMTGDTRGGIEDLMVAIAEAPSTTSDKLFAGVISQIPLNLYLRGHAAEARQAARAIEVKFGTDPKRLLALAGFYLRLEHGEEAVRVATEAVKLAPDSAEAHHTLGLALHISLRLEEAAAEYERALELDPNLKQATRRNLADLSRAAGKSEKALTLYRMHLDADPKDKAARAGVILSLLELGRIEEADTELTNALQIDPNNLALLTGAAYWFAAHHNSERALELARRAVEIEPRYTWAQIALARALIGQKRPLEAERALRFARLYGKFPTLEYELASVLAAAGLYDEAAELLRQTFTLKDGMIEARLAGGNTARESDFLSLLAAERQAGLFQFGAADTAANAAMLKALLAFSVAITASAENAAFDEIALAAAAKEFASGPDDMRVYRQLYAANQLLAKSVALKTAYELTEAARSSVDEALAVPAVTVAVQAEEFRDIRARAIARGGTPDIADAPRNVLANILRGRIEDLAGWSLFNQNKPEEAVEHLKRATNILPEGTPAWRTALWHLGAAYDLAGDQQEALNHYIRSYIAGDPEPGRRAVIELLYQRTHGTLDGLNERIGAAPVATNVSPDPAPEKVIETSPTPAASPQGEVVSPDSTPSPSPVGSTPEEIHAAKPENTQPEGTPPDESKPAPSPESQVTSPEATSSPQSSPTPEPEKVSPDAPGTSAETTAAPSSATPQRVRSSRSMENLPGTVLPATVKISGRVRDKNGSPLASVVVVLISPRGSVLATTTSGEGSYSFVIAPSLQNYRIIPSKDGYTFEPIDKVLVSLTEDQKEIDFVGIVRSP